MARDKIDPVDWSDWFIYQHTTDFVTVTLADKPTPEKLQVFDVWGIIYFDSHRTELDNRELVLRIDCATASPYLEALIRRVSYLTIIRRMTISVIVQDEAVALYNAEELLNRPKNEVIRNYRKPAVPGNDLAAFIAGTGIATDLSILTTFKTFLLPQTLGKCPAHCCNKQVMQRLTEFRTALLADAKSTESRIEILGDDFQSTPRPIIHKYKAEVFDSVVKTSCCLMNAGTVDLLTLNAHQQVSLITIAKGDSLRAVSQMLDSALYFAAYWNRIGTSSHLATLLDMRSEDLHASDVMSYIVTTQSNPCFDRVISYYLPKSPFSFGVKHVRLGQTESLT